MKKSKYVGRRFQGWKVTKIYLAANYEHGTRHNAYRYMLERITSDAKCVKKVTASGPTMKKIAEGKINLEKYADRKGNTQTNYEFVHSKN